MLDKTSILITDLGGEGGGTLMNWILECARKKNLYVQGTSVPGVAQRTGSTSYYIEICSTSFEFGKEPVLSMYPVAGMVDIVISSELLETARVMERGFVNPERTTLISSESRALTNTEKSHLYDGRFDSKNIIETGFKMAKKSIFIDLQDIAEENFTIISSPMFGAIAATKLLPWNKEVFETVFSEDEYGKKSLAGFRSAFNKVNNKEYNLINQKINNTEIDKNNTLKLDIQVPDSLKNTINLGMSRCEEYQNSSYAETFLNRVNNLISHIDPKEENVFPIIETAAKRLCLWMAYEDIPRVAQLKISKTRIARIKKEVNFKEGQVLVIKDYFKPGVDEIIAIMPNKLGKWFSRNKKIFKLFPFVGKGMKINPVSITGHLLLKLLSSFRYIRLISYRYNEEVKEINTWLEAMKLSLNSSLKYADALSDLPHLLKGYGDTLMRGKEKYSKIYNALVRPIISRNISDIEANNLKEAISIAMNSSDISELDGFLLEKGSQIPAIN